VRSLLSHRHLPIKSRTLKREFIPGNKDMQLSKKAIDDFKKIYFEEFKVELSDEEANVKGLELLNFIKLIYKPIPISTEVQK
jgi:hypothetical protein